MKISRRLFLGAAAALSLSAKSLKTIGVQLYTVRRILPEKPAETLDALEQVGFREAEASQADIDRIWPFLQKTSLKPVSMHADSALFLPGREAQLEESIAGARGRGFAYLVYPYLPPEQRGGLDAMRRLAERLNLAGEKCRKAGLELCYHNHAFEFDPNQKRVPIDVLMENTEPKLVSLELDIFWVSVAGHDPINMVKRYDGRIPLLHLKDKAEGFPVHYSENVPRGVFKEVGAGVLDIPGVLKAASKAGVKHYFVEQDETSGDPLKSLARSYDYLKRLQF
ncbi:MAG: sugar phosphate isomerase/epimerase [Acidobacteria bacterium]|nr:sugar phosphate isomerase/epimerase [Acidobacteriota bacterium]